MSFFGVISENEGLAI